MIVVALSPVACPSSCSLALGHRIARCLQNWRKQHPHGFYARPEVNKDGSTNLFKWYVGHDAT